MNERQLYFKTNVLLKNIIGKDLINDDNIALLELVKNSFDADAKSVTVTFLNIKQNDDAAVQSFSQKTSRLIIRDNGMGMTIEDIEQKWLNIAYSEKKSNRLKHNRRMAGAKGVGRFSCDRLGEYLNLYAKTKSEKSYVKLSIDWKQFEVEDENKEIQTVALDLEHLTDKELIEAKISPFDQGVVLEIIKLRSHWSQPHLEKKESEVVLWNVEKFQELKRYLEKLINPNQAFSNDDFIISIDAPEFHEENSLLDDHSKFIGNVENRIFEELNFRSTSIEVKTNEEGLTTTTTLRDKGEVVFWITETNTFFPLIKNVKITTYFLNTYAKAFFTKQTGYRSVDYGSIFLFINGFRISPYGEVGNDWLGIDSRKAQGYARYIGLREIVGQIEILDENNDFQIISSREGVVKNDHYKTLTQNNGYFFKSFRRLERYVVEGLNWDRAAIEDEHQKIHNKIVAGELNEEELLYKESESIKKARVYNSIHSIISASPEEVIELYINEGLILQKIDVEREASEKEFRQLLEDFNFNRIEPEILTRILYTKAQKNEELARELREFGKFTVNDITSKAVLEIEEYRKTIEFQTNEIKELQKKLQDLQDRNATIEASIESLTEQASTAEINLNIEKEKNLYLLATRRTLSADADGIIHTIVFNNLAVRDGLDNLIDDLTNGNMAKKNIIEKLGHLKINAERSLKMAEFATRSEYNKEIEVRVIDVVKYIIEYVELYGDPSHKKMHFHFINPNLSLTKSMSVLNLSIVIDNLISNSMKWQAENMAFEFNLVSENRLEVTVSDDGEGVSSKFIRNPQKMFELSARDNAPSALGGSGIGLYYSKHLLNEMNSDIEFIGNNIKHKGASFKLIFRTI
jgi:Histidine kinase-, DNA gyrase B-, and HSP90-like ATPase.